MFRKGFKFFMIVMQICVICVLIMLSLFLWRLHKAPIDIDPFIPYIVEAATSSENKISIQSAQIRWGGWRHPIEISAKEFKAFDKKEDLILSVPEMAVSFSIPALLRGLVAPRAMSFYEPYLHITINKEGKVEQEDLDKKESVSFKEKESQASKETLEERASVSLNSLVRILKEEKHLSEFSLIRAQIKVTDELHQAVWNMPNVNLTYSRSFKRKNIQGSVAIEIKDKKHLILDIEGRWKEIRKELDFSVGIENLDLKDSRAAQKYPYLKNFTTPISLVLDTQINVKPLLKTGSFKEWMKMINKVDFYLSGKEGIINLPSPVFARYDLKDFSVQGSWLNAGNDFDISEFEINTTSGGFASGRFSISGISDAIRKKTWTPIRARLQAKAQNVQINFLPDYWPGSIGPSVHKWVKDNIKQGVAKSADFDLEFIGLKEGGVDAHKLTGTVEAENTTVRYLDDMPLVQDVSGVLDFTRDAIIITVNEGHTKSIEAQKGGTVSFLDLSKEVSSMALNLDLEGSVPDVLTVLDSPFLEITKTIGIKPENTTGRAEGNLKISLPLGEAFTGADDVKINVTADVFNADINDIALGYGLQDAILSLTLEGKDLNLKGSSLFYGAATEYSVFLTFDETKHIASDIDLHINLNDKARNALGYERFINANNLSGFTPTHLEMKTTQEGLSTLQINSDLTQSLVNIREIGWYKPLGVEGQFDFKMSLLKGKPQSIPLIHFFDKNNANIQGSALFNQNHEVEKVIFQTIKTARTDAFLDIDFYPEGTEFNLEAKTFDISGLIKNTSTSTPTNPLSSQRQEKKESDKKKEERDETQNKTLSFKALVEKLWLSSEGYTQDNTISAFYEDEWTSVIAAGFVGEEKVPYSAFVQPTQTPNEYSVSMRAQDAGYILKALDYASTVKGGVVELNGIYVPKKGSKGEMKISKFYLQEDKILTHILMMTSLTGIIDSFRGEGLFFDKADVPYETNQSLLEIKEAVISGASLGITLKGKVYRDTGYVNLRGSLIPFYTLNSFLGKIPLVGKLFAGEKGGGLIAPTYTIKGKLPSPRVSVNAFSALAPGAIRSIFGSFGANDKDLSKIEEDQTQEEEKEKLLEPLALKPLNPEEEKEFQDILHKNKERLSTLNPFAPEQQKELQDHLHKNKEPSSTLPLKTPEQPKELQDVLHRE